MPKILYISYDGMTDPLGQSQVLPYLKGLSQLGYEIHVLSFEKPANLQREGFAVQTIIDNAGLCWYPQDYTSSPPVLSTLKDLRTMMRNGFALHAEHGFDIVHARSYISALAALKLKQKHGVPFVFDMRGFWADERLDGGLWSLKNPMYRLVYNYFKRKEKQFFNSADVVVSLTHAAVPHIRKISGTENLQVDIIPCCADLDHFHFERIDENEKTRLRKHLGIGADDKVLSYLGSLGTWYMSREMLEFFRIAKEHGVFDKILIISKDDKQQVLAEAASAGIDPVDVIISPATRDEVPGLLSVSMANIFFIKPCFSKLASSPTKFAEVLGMGIPVIVNAGVGDIEVQIKETGTGLVLSELTSDGILKAVQELKTMQMPAPDICRNAALKYFDLKNGVLKYQKIYERIIKK